MDNEIKQLPADTEEPLLKPKRKHNITEEHKEKLRENMKKANAMKVEKSIPLAEAKAQRTLEKALKAQSILERRKNYKKDQVEEEQVESPPPTPPPVKAPKKKPSRKVVIQESSDSEDYGSSGSSTEEEEVVYVQKVKKSTPKKEITKSKQPMKKEELPPAYVFKFV